MPAQAFTRPVTLVTGEGDWTFDRLGLGRRAILSVPEGRTLTLANGLDGVFAIEGEATSLYGVLRYDGGTLALGSKTTQTMNGKWTFAPRTPYTVNGDLALVNGARLGVQDLPAIYDQTATLPEYGICTATVTGNLSVDEASMITVRGAGVRKEGNTENNGFKGVLPGSTHGGRSSANAWIDQNPDPVNRYHCGNDRRCGKDPRGWRLYLELARNGRTRRGQADADGGGLLRLHGCHLGLGPLGYGRAGADDARRLGGFGLSGDGKRRREAWHAAHCNDAGELECQQRELDGYCLRGASG
ncbi:MAG: hypothetical protein ACI4QF_04415 [Kiritimatiellia bacterium]